MSAFIREFKTTNELLFKERNNSLSELRRGKTTTQGIRNDNTHIHNEEPSIFIHAKPDAPKEVLGENEPRKAKEQVVQLSIKVQKPSIPFPRRLRKEKEEAQQRKFLENLKQLHINLPFIEALDKMPKYAKFLKSLLTNKATLEEACTVTKNERCLAVLLNKLPSKEKNPGSFTIPCNIVHLHINNALADLGASISLMPYTMYEKLDQSIKRPLAEDDECYGIDDLDETINLETQKMLGSDQLDSFLLKGLKKSINQSDLESCDSIRDTSRDGSDLGTPIRRIEPELKDLPHHLEYVYLHGDKSFSIIILSKLFEKEKMLLLQVLEAGKGAISLKKTDFKGISLSFCTHNILIEDDFKPVIQPQRHLNPKVQDVLKNKIFKLLDSGLIYPILDSSWVSPIHVFPKKGGTTVVLNENNELIPSRTVTGWRVCIDYQKLNVVTRKDHFTLLFINQMLERLSVNEYYCFLGGFSGFFQIPIELEDQEKTTFICPYETFAYRRIPFGLSNAPATFQRCVTVIFHDMVEDFMEVFMDDFLVFGNSFSCCLANLDKMLARPVPKKPTASPSGNKKNGVAHTNEVSNSNSFDVLNLFDNDVEFGTNGGTINLVNNGDNLSGSSFMNIKNSSTCYTPIIDKIGKFEDLLIDGQVILVDDVGNPLKKVECPGDYDSEYEVASVDNDMAHSLASEWDLPQGIQAICDNLDIRVRDRKKK
uniref:DNA-directed DNA polymerase n=1 Tax=Tanacetum cinerariifolium TaxID=118510 RepID=A0A6L2KHK5_TANCI|nr:DNA-directed DNA polymerase [Tanacetum cinerariifolium]